MNKNDQQFIAQKIRTQYMEKEPSELDALRALDARAKRPALIFAYVYGIIGALVMGIGMSLLMTDVGAVLGMTNTTVTGVVIGAIGMLMVLVNYPFYKCFLGSRKQKYSAEIIKLSDNIIN